jgi:hypothetical protein
LSVLFILFMMGCNPEGGNNDRNAQELWGPVKSVRDISYEAVVKSGEIVKGKKSSPNWWKDSYTVFDRKGEGNRRAFL